MQTKKREKISQRPHPNKWIYSSMKKSLFISLQFLRRSIDQYRKLNNVKLILYLITTLLHQIKGVIDDLSLAFFFNKTPNK